VPVVFKCRGCGKTIEVYVRGSDNEVIVPEPYLAGKKCPHCGRVLERPTPRDIKLK